MGTSDTSQPQEASALDPSENVNVNPNQTTCAAKNNTNVETENVEQSSGAEDATADEYIAQIVTQFKQRH